MHIGYNILYSSPEPGDKLQIGLKSIMQTSKTIEGARVYVHRCYLKLTIYK